MNENEMLYCLIGFILGWLVSRHMGNGFSVGAIPACDNMPSPATYNDRQACNWGYYERDCTAYDNTPEQRSCNVGKYAPH